jgi:hypothetical protein
MIVLFYSSPDQGGAQRFETRIQTKFPQMTVKHFISIDSLSEEITKKTGHFTVIVFFISDRDELVDIVMLGDLLRGYRIIFILPDRDDETIALAHLMRPRFLSFGNDDLSSVIEVMDKMYHHQREVEASYEAR